jgi:hypothetical protein
MAVCLTVLFGLCGSSVHADKLYYRRSGEILRADLDGRNREVFDNSGTNYGAMAVDSQNQNLYYAYYVNVPGPDNITTIRRTGMFGGPSVDVATWDDLPDVLAIDHVEGKVYWTESDLGYIKRVDFDGTTVQTPFTGLNTPIAVAVDSARGRVYWMDYESPGGPLRRIQRAEIGGPTTTLLTGLDDAWGLRFAEGLDRMYWIDSDTIRSADLDGNDVQHVINAPGAKDLAIDVGRSRLYWTDQNGGGEITRANLDGTGAEELGIGGAPLYLALSLNDCNDNGVPDDDDISSGTSADDDGNGVPDDCQPDCNDNGVLDATDITAGTSEDIDGDGRPDECCYLDQDTSPGCNQVGFVYWSTVFSDEYDPPISTIWRAKLDGSSTLSFGVDAYVAYKLELDKGAGKIYWVDTFADGIFRANTNLSGTAEQLIAGAEGIKGLTLDLINGKMYWTDHIAQTISRANLDGSAVEIVLSSSTLGGASSDVAVDPAEGKLYWTDGGTSSIQRANLDGSDQELLVSGVQPSRLQLDLCAGKMYWGVYYSIQRANLDGSDVETLVDGRIDRVFDLSLDIPGGKLYWSEQSPGGLFRSNLDGSFIEQLDINITDWAYGIAVGWWSLNDCNDNGVVDTCETITGLEPDCNGNTLPDSCDIESGWSPDFDDNGIPDECEDCNGNGVDDFDDVATGTSEDCNANNVPDECELPQDDCNENGIADGCDVRDGTSNDCDDDGFLDECALDAGSADCNDNAVPDECEPDCNSNGVADECDIADGTGTDCNGNTVLDECDLADGTSEDCTSNGTPDECEPDCNENGVPDSCDTLAGTSEDCDGNEVPDECDPDCNGNGTPDRCECLAALPPTPELNVIAKNRYLSFIPDSTNPGCSNAALRVTITDLPLPFEPMEGQTYWIGDPHPISERSGFPDPDDTPPTFIGTKLQCTPHCMDWNGVGLMHAYGPEVVPGATYSIQAIACACDAGMEGNYSIALNVATGVWGDIVAPYGNGSGDQPDFADISELVEKFKNAPGAPIKARTDVAPEIPDSRVDYVDIAWVVDAFQGSAFPFAGPAPCE